MEGKNWLLAHRSNLESMRGSQGKNLSTHVTLTFKSSAYALLMLWLSSLLCSLGPRQWNDTTPLGGVFSSHLAISNHYSRYAKVNLSIQLLIKSPFPQGTLCQIRLIIKTDKHTVSITASTVEDLCLHLWLPVKSLAWCSLTGKNLQRYFVNIFCP